MSTPIETAIARADELARVMIDEYAGWRGKLAYGPELHAMYMDTFAFVNFRVETADTCLLLIRNGRVADSLGLCRSLLENHLLFMLMCRGTKLFKLEDLTTLTDGQFKQRLAERKAELAELQAVGKTSCLAVEKYPKAKRHLMYVFHGYKSPDPELPDFMIPEHYFHFRQFRPESLRLNDDNYFQSRIWPTAIIGLEPSFIAESQRGSGRPAVRDRCRIFRGRRMAGRLGDAPDRPVLRLARAGLQIQREPSGCPGFIARLQGSAGIDADGSISLPMVRAIGRRQ
jgi:hypothetical protein